MKGGGKLKICELLKKQGPNAAVLFTGKSPVSNNLVEGAKRCCNEITAAHQLAGEACRVIVDPEGFNEATKRHAR